MEEKERYVIKDRKVVDTELNKTIYFIDNYVDKPVIDILNQQDNRIKELEEYIKSKEMADNDNLQKENQQLKQQLNDLPKKIVEEIRDDMSKRIIEKQIKWGDNIQIGFICNAINECLDTILKKYGGEI